MVTHFLFSQNMIVSCPCFFLPHKTRLVDSVALYMMPLINEIISCRRWKFEVLKFLHGRHKNIMFMVQILWNLLYHQARNKIEQLWTNVFVIVMYIHNHG